MNDLPHKKQFEEAAAELAIAPAMVEKDWHVIDVLACIAKLNLQGFQIVFSGGTSLSKAHRLIKRFSEDIDFKIVPVDEAPNRSVLSKYKNSIIDRLEEAGFDIDRTSITARDNNRFFSFNIRYKAYFPETTGLRPHIQLEFTVAQPVLSTIKKPVSSFISQLKKDKPEVENIDCINPIEIAADKLSALVWRIPKHVPENKPADRSLVRHMHDLAMLSSIVKESTHFPTLVMATLEQDNERNKDISRLSANVKLQLLIDTLGNDAEKYRAEYDTFVNSVSYAEENTTPDFNSVIQSLHQLIDTVSSSEL